MIFSGIGRNGKSSVDMIYSGEKTQTRRQSNRYIVGRTYAVQPKRCAPADSRGRIRILNKWCEVRDPEIPILLSHAQAEGNYMVEEYENLYRYLYPKWEVRWAYEFAVVK